MLNSAPAWMNAGHPHIWLPYVQMKTADDPLPVVATEGCRLHLADGRVLIDGIASWWTACHGYRHPHIVQAIHEQLDRLPHVMFGGLVHEPALALASRLCALLGPGFERVFLTESGSVSVEVAMKMARQYWFNQGQPRRRRILSFAGGYHGDTFGTMAVCDPAIGMHAAFASMLPAQDVMPLPVDAASEACLDAVLQQEAGHIAALLVEPLVQGAAGMRMHAPQVLQRLRALADRHGVLLIFDEIFTGFGRTGSLFAFEQAGVQPDILTLSKALTGGTLPLAATVANARVCAAFWSDDPGHALMHGPTYMGNPLACAAAMASLDLFATEPRLPQVHRIEATLREQLAVCQTLPGVREIRVKGAIAAVELHAVPDRAALCRAFVRAGVWVRPLGRVVYLTPSFVISHDELTALTQAIHEVLRVLPGPSIRGAEREA
ncbi:adenosylmethionine--8-amino-7-oxononanoate transaminase [Castellaniella caeni]|uniref:adenosylmethionine--8-amino-7-oxononanoate transaminase n=1 Tax=Castellaniella caeni TaxID=266123 RepID=UPI000C9FAD48|nr:adenosylmethionine--8-amino-7-oxononanoate transaminase [Castellaniella caeni]